MLKIFTTAAFATVLGLVLAGGAHASAICDQIDADLTSLSQSNDTPSKIRKYARAIAEQKMSIRELKNQMRETGCSGGSLFVVGGDNQNECGTLEAKMMRMETNLSILNEKRLDVMTGQDQDTRRQDLLASLDENDCNAEPMEASVPVIPEQPLVTQNPDGFETIRVPSQQASYQDRQFVDLGGTSANGSYRTMCVRTCDGAYFPISSQASSMGFERDAQVCSMMCPGTETELYYNSLRQESDAMRSTSTGLPYDELDNAYRFRTRTGPRDKTCGCNFSLYYKEMMRREAYINDPEKEPIKQSAIVWIKPELRGQLTESLAKAPVKDAALRDYKPNGKIREIGPKFLPDDTQLDFQNAQAALKN